MWCFPHVTNTWVGWVNLGWLLSEEEENQMEELVGQDKKQLPITITDKTALTS